METKSLQLEQKIVQPKTYFLYRTTTTLNDLMDVADKEISGLLETIEKLGLEHDGPMEFVYFDCTNDMDKPFTLEIAQPVVQQVAYDARKYAFRQTERFKCLSKTHLGDINKISETYEGIFKDLMGSNTSLTNEIREVYHKYNGLSDPANVTEIQIGFSE